MMESEALSPEENAISRLQHSLAQSRTLEPASPESEFLTPTKHANRPTRMSDGTAISYSPLVPYSAPQFSTPEALSASTCESFFSEEEDVERTLGHKRPLPYDEDRVEKKSKAPSTSKLQALFCQSRPPPPPFPTQSRKPRSKHLYPLRLKGDRGLTFGNGMCALRNAAGGAPLNARPGNEPCIAASSE